MTLVQRVVQSVNPGEVEVELKQYKTCNFLQLKHKEMEWLASVFNFNNASGRHSYNVFEGTIFLSHHMVQKTCENEESFVPDMRSQRPLFPFSPKLGRETKWRRFGSKFGQFNEPQNLNDYTKSKNSFTEILLIVSRISWAK